MSTPSQGHPSARAPAPQNSLLQDAEDHGLEVPQRQYQPNSDECALMAAGALPVELPLYYRGLPGIPLVRALESDYRTSPDTFGGQGFPMKGNRSFSVVILWPGYEPFEIVMRARGTWDPNDVIKEVAKAITKFISTHQNFKKSKDLTNDVPQWSIDKLGYLVLRLNILEIREVARWKFQPVLWLSHMPYPHNPQQLP